ncbi:MAG: RIP metalloprotease RseP [Bacteroidales bacterium]|jgi:regulator of sigma E protease|nr:RIP metalloprotease RseP [Bacteroidales bacterium]
MGISTQILGLIASLAFLILTHEFGHFFFARLFKTRVDKFYLFFNPWFSVVRMKKFDNRYHFSFFSAKSPEEWAEHPDATEWGIGWLPLGGYCSINGMVDETTKVGDLATEQQPYEFRSKPAWQRFFIILGGVLVNFISAMVFYVAILFTWGESYIPMKNARYGLQFTNVAKEIGFQNGDKIISVDGKPVKTVSDFTFSVLLDSPKEVELLRNDKEMAVEIPKDFAQSLLRAGDKFFCEYNFPFVVDSIEASAPAYRAGMRRGDSLVGVNDTLMFSFMDFQQIFAQNKAQAIKVNFYRDDSLMGLPVTLTDEGKLGVHFKSPYAYLEIKTKEYGFLESIPAGISHGFGKLTDYVKQFKLFKTKEGISQLGGFGTIGSIFPKTWDWEKFWSLTAFLAIALAFMNFLPIPALDGGYILFILIEMITRRKPSDKFIGYANTIGFTLLIFLMLYANGMDVFRFLGK